MDFHTMEHILMEQLRLYHHPVAVTWLFSEADLEDFKAKSSYVMPVKPLTFCQMETAARMQGKTVLADARSIACSTAKISFGWADVDEREIKNHLKFCEDAEQTRQFLLSKPCLPKDSLRALAVGPLGKAAVPPHIVHFYCDSIQSYHLAVDYMAAMNRHPLHGQICLTSSTCGGSVLSWQEKNFNFTTVCAGSYNAGKTERGEIYVFIPGEQIEAVVQRLLRRIETGGSSSVTRPGDYFPGADVCKNCPLIAFKTDNTPAQECAACEKEAGKNNYEVLVGRKK